MIWTYFTTFFVAHHFFRDESFASETHGQEEDDDNYDARRHELGEVRPRRAVNRIVELYRRIGCVLQIRPAILEPVCQEIMEAIADVPLEGIGNLLVGHVEVNLKSFTYEV